MIAKKYFYRIRVKVRDIKKVLEAYNALNEKCFIEFRPAGIFSKEIDVIFGDFYLTHQLGKAGCDIYIKDVEEFSCTDMEKSDEHSLNIRVSNPVVFIGDTDEEVNQQIEKYKKDKEEPLTYTEIKKVVTCLVSFKTT